MSCLFRGASLSGPGLRDGLRCPACGRIDWRRDGITVGDAGPGGVTISGPDVPRGRSGDWQCSACGHIATESSRPSRLLARAVIAVRYRELG